MKTYKNKGRKLTKEHVENWKNSMQTYWKNEDVWNKGKTKETDARIKAYGEKQRKKFNKEDIEYILNSYFNENKLLKDICKEFGCSVNPIKRIINESNLQLKKHSQVRKEYAKKNRKNIINEIIINDKKIKVENGFLRKYAGKIELNKGAILNLDCDICNKKFKRSYFYQKKYLDTHFNQIICPSCATHIFNNKIKISKQQKYLCDELNGKINYLISNIFVDKLR